MFYNTDITLNKSELMLIQTIDSNKILKMRDELIRNSIPKYAELIATHATYLKKRIDNSELTEFDIHNRFDDLTANFIDGEFPYSVCIKINKKTNYLSFNPFKNINQILSDIILIIDSNVLFEDAKRNEKFDIEIKNKLNYLSDILFYNENKSNIFDSISEALNLFCVPGKWINNGKQCDYEVKKTANPFEDFDTFYSFITNPHTTLKNLIEHESEEDISMTFLNKYSSNEIISNKVLSMLVVFKYIQFRSFLFEFENIMDLIVLSDTILGYIIDNEEIDAPILSTVIRSFSDQINIAMNKDQNSFYSKEGIDGTEFTINKSNAKTLNGVKLSDVNEKYKSKSMKLKQAWIKTFKMGPEKRKMAKDAKFFRKFFGRIPGLYQSYGSEAKVYENRMKDDPAKVLANDAVKYIDNLTQFSDNQFNELINLSRKISSSSDSVQRMSYVSSYCKHYKIDTQSDPKLIRAQILNETYFRIATALFNKITIYGFTVEGVVQNHKFPSANHIIVSMFINNPNETPEELSVNEIFKNPNSLLVFSKPENFTKFTNLYATASAKLIGSFNDKNIGSAVDEMRKTSSRVDYQLKNENGQSANEQADPKTQKEVMKAIEKGMIDSIDLMIDQKQRVLQCAAVAYQMISRISRTARLCVTAMLEIESKRTDKSYSGSFNDKSNRKDIKRLKANRDHVEKQENISERKVNRNGLARFSR